MIRPRQGSRMVMNTGKPKSRINAEEVVQDEPLSPSQTSQAALTGPTNPPVSYALAQALRGFGQIAKHSRLLPKHF